MYKVCLGTLDRGAIAGRHRAQQRTVSSAGGGDVRVYSVCPERIHSA